MECAKPDATERVGPLEMRVEVSEPTPESEKRWANRVETLAAWFAAQWRCEQEQVKVSSAADAA